MSELIEFESLKFNLYEILNISPEASENKIRKAYKNLILHFHPDKNNEASEEVYLHIIKANQILTNKELRKNYDEYLNRDKVEDYFEMKNNFSKHINTKPFTNKEEAFKSFEQKLQELNTKHNYNNNEYSSELTKLNYEKLLKEREQPIEIIKDEINNIDEFNMKFQDNKTNKSFNDQLIPVQQDLKLSIYNINNAFTTLDMAFDNLYVDGGGVQTDKYTSLDAAFKIQDLTPTVENVNVEDAIKKYKEASEIYSSPSFEFSKENFDLW
jgi:curved DNA-binding protein CbpA